jgi:hypothetical protein
MKPLKTPPVQYLFERQGHIVIACDGFDRPHKIGDVLPGLRGGTGYHNVDGPVLIIAEATREEWLAQSRSVGVLSDPDKSGRWVRFWKVVAE